MPLFWAQAALTFILVAVCVRPLGLYMARVFEGERTILTPLLSPVERFVYRVCRIQTREMSWKTYAAAGLAVSVTSIAATYVLLRTQGWLPLNPQQFANLAPDLAWNTAVSFATTTDWQAYSGESTMSYLSQMAALAWQNFLAAAVGLAISIAFIRGLARANAQGLGNFWVDLTRALLYVLLPLSVLGGLAFAIAGVPQNLHGYLDVATVEGAKQTITGGPMASQEIIKLLGGNGGGFVAANSASPNENPSPLSNVLQLWMTFVIPAALTFTFGRMVRRERQGWALFAAMTVLFVGGLAVAGWAEGAGNPLVHQLGIAGGNMEGKEVRFGAAGSGLSVAVATDATTGSANVAYDSLTPIGGLVALVNMQLGEVAFGGVGSGLYGMLLLVVTTVFIAGLMVGRTPEYLGKKIEGRDMQYVMLSLLIFPLAVLVPAAIAIRNSGVLAGLGNGGPHGFSEVLYAFTSVSASNGSAFGGLTANTLFMNVATGIAMLLGRYGAAIPALALAGSLARKPVNPQATAGTFSTSSPMFIGLLVAVVVVVGALTFLPADALGPIAEQLLMQKGTTF